VCSQAKLSKECLSVFSYIVKCTHVKSLTSSLTANDWGNRVSIKQSLDMQ
jgi:hypothetical protein